MNENLDRDMWIASTICKHYHDEPSFIPQNVCDWIKEVDKLWNEREQQRVTK